LSLTRPLRSHARLRLLWIGLLLASGTGAFGHPVIAGEAASPPDQPFAPDSTTQGRLARHRDEISRLAAELETTADRDSIRFELAKAWRGTGTVDGRQRAFDLFAKVKSRYFDDPAYHLELARTYLEGNRRADARDEFERALRRDRSNVEARLVVARILREYVLRYGQPEDANEALTFLAETTQLAPESSAAHLEYALCLQLARMYVPGDHAAQGLAVVREAEKVLERDPSNRTARALRAVAWLDLGRAEEADRELREASTASGPAGREDLLGRTAPTPLHWTDPIAARTAAPDSFDWSGLDPTPLTPANEAALEYRRRLLLADLFYGEPERGRRGWMTPRGELFVRYGPPRAMQFRLARWEEAEAMVPVDLALAKKRAHLNASGLAPFQSPVQSWVYDFDGRAVVFDFADPTLQGDFVPLDGWKHEEQKHELPLALLDTFAGRRPQYYFAAAGTRDVDGRTRLLVSLALPPPGAGEADVAVSRPGVRILDPSGREITGARLTPVSANEPTPLPGWARQTSRGEVVLPPGRYSAEVRFDVERAAGSFVAPVVARDFQSERFAISDLWLAFPPEIPNPAGFAAPRSKLLVRYEVYNFSPAVDGKVRYRSRFSVVPRSYALAAARMSGPSGSDFDAGLILDGLGRTLGGITLNARNYLDVVFPDREEPLVPGARGRFTFELDASSLEAGEYALTVAVEDRVAHRTVMAQSQVRVLDEAGLRALTTGN
jgi:GWxTD domain-containing protein